MMPKPVRGAVTEEGSWRRSDLSTSPPSIAGDSETSLSCSVGIQDNKGSHGMRGERTTEKCWYRTQLEEEVQRLQKKLQEEIDLHLALATAVAQNADPLLNSPCKLPEKAQELLDNIAELEMTVSKLEEELLSLHLQLCNERNERRVAENHVGCFSSILPDPQSTSSVGTWEEHISSLRVSKFRAMQIPSPLHQDKPSSGDSQLHMVNISQARCHHSEVLNSCDNGGEDKKEVSLRKLSHVDLKNINLQKKLWQNPNELSQEMVRCMRNIFLCLSESSNASPKGSSDCLPSQSSPVGHLSSSSFTSLSDSSAMPSTLRSPNGPIQSDEVMEQPHSFDPYGINKTNWGIVGSYRFATEVSWMSVGKAQLEYAAEALKKFRFLVEQLAKVNPALMSGNEKLAFWINVYNALIMHAYLAYGVPKSDIKLFSLMQKASYTIGGLALNAAEIEFVILKVKPPAHRQQLALVVALHKFKNSDEHKRYSIEDPEPLTVFALSCGMYSSPAVRIFTPDSVQDKLEACMRDYIQASISISDKGKILLPKLLHCFAKGVVEDSLLVDWFCRYLSPDQVTILRDSTSQRKQRLLGVRSFSVIPFDSRFRYLFLPDSKTSQKYAKDQSG